MINLLNDFELIELLKQMSIAADKGEPVTNVLAGRNLMLSDVLAKAADRLEELEEIGQCGTC